MADITGLHLGSKLKDVAKAPWRAIKGLTGLPNPSEIPGSIATGAQKILGDKPAQITQIPRFTPQQQQVMDLLLQLGGENVTNPYEGFEPIRQNALEDFFQNIVPGLKEGFAGSGNYSSPILQTNLSSAGSSLAQKLATLQSEYGMQNRQAGLQQLQLGLNPYNENIFQPSSPGFLKNLLGSLGGAVGPLSQLYQNQQTLNLLKQLQSSR